MTHQDDFLTTLRMRFYPNPGHKFRPAAE